MHAVDFPRPGHVHAIPWGPGLWESSCACQAKPLPSGVPAHPLSHALQAGCSLQLLLGSLLLQEMWSMEKADVGSSLLGTSCGPWDTGMMLNGRSSFWSKLPAPWEGQA